VGELLFRLPSSVIDRSQLSTVPAAVESLREMVSQIPTCSTVMWGASPMCQIVLGATFRNTTAQSLPDDIIPSIFFGSFHQLFVSGLLSFTSPLCSLLLSNRQISYL
jgi:hypothetical protein